ncbi:hypothetical protein J5X84_29355 [Streptosporangiaceae bacterium NEAU-GS5]|nr:hypothetical protein [Streptosporangiaceae bacterium NEAU-GS5]
MRTSVRTMLGLAAATAIVGLGAPLMAAAPASATTATTASSPSWDWDDFDYSNHWGPYYSQNYKAKAKGHIDVSYDGYHSNEVDINGRLYDYDHRDSKCAYVKIRYQYWYDHHWYTDYLSYYNCDNHHPYYFNTPTLYDVSKVQVKVCQVYKWDAYDNDGYYHPFKCGGWYDIYNVWNKHYDYDWDNEHGHSDHDDEA